MSERLKVSVLKTEVSIVDTGGSNPSPSVVHTEYVIVITAISYTQYPSTVT